MQKPLTATAVAKLKPGKSRIEIPDGACPGLYLVVQPSGAKSWALRFRRPSGKPAKLVLGSVYVAASKEPETPPAIGGHLTLAAAHRLVAELRHRIAQGRDPAAAYLAEKERTRAGAIENAENTFAAAAKNFIEQHARKRVRRWKEQARLLGFEPTDLTLRPKGLANRWAGRPVAEIDGHDLYSIIDETRRLGAPGLERRSEGETESRARAMHAVLSKLFSWLLQHRRTATNPCVGVHRPAAARARERVLTDVEIVQLWAATGIVGEPFGAVLKLLLLTGCRLNEIAGLRWEDVSADQLNIPGNRAKNHRPYVVALSPLAREILAGVPRIERCPFVFSTTGRSPISGWSKIKMRLDAAMGISPWRLHDIRRTVVTQLVELGIAPHLVELIVNHVSGIRAGVAGTYNRSEMLPERRTALERWAAHIAGLVTAKPADVVPLRGQQ